MAWDARNSWNVDMVQPVNRLCSLNRGLQGWWLGIPGITGGRRFIDIWNPGPNGNHGALTNMDPATDWVASSRGGRALDFDGGNQYVRVGAISSLQTSHVTTSVWVYFYSTALQMNFFEHQGYVVFKPTTQNIVVFFNSDNRGSAAAAIVAGRWYHVATTYDKVNVRIYIDGVLRGLGYQTAALSYSGFTDFGGTGTTNNLDGLLDDARIFNRALTASEVEAVFHDSLQGYPRTLRRMGRVIFPAAVVGFAGKSHIIGGGMVA